MRQLCHIVGAGHSGSTLLGMVLNGPATNFYVGEGRKALNFGNSNLPEKKRSCRLCGPRCKIWSAVSGDQIADIYFSVSRLTGSQTLIDSTKRIGWVDQLGEALSGQAVSQSMIFIYRSPFAVINSRIRKYPNIDVDVHISKWADQVTSTLEHYKSFEGSKYILSYESFCESPVSYLSPFSSLLGVEIVESHLEFWKTEHHLLGANTGTQFVASRSAGVEAGAYSTRLAAPARSSTFYERHPQAIRPDHRWKTELGNDARALIERRTRGIDDMILEEMANHEG